MNDEKIVELYWARSEDAIRFTDEKYGRMLCSVSRSLLDSDEDTRECVNDTYLTAWNRMPADRPTYLGAYLSKIIRAISISRFRSLHRQKRGGVGNITQELTECVPDSKTLEEEYENGMLAKAINSFVLGLDEQKRYIFVRRYFYSDDIRTIAQSTGESESKVKTALFRMRAQLKEILESEDLL